MESSDAVPQDGQQTPPEKAGSGKAWKKILLVVLVVFLFILAIGGVYAWLFTSAYNGITIEPVDLGSLPDGAYPGSWQVYHVKVSVNVTIQDHRIVGMEVVDAGGSGNSGEGQDNLETLGVRIVEEQSPQVDTVSGATATQKVYLKAVEEALGGESQ